MLLNKNKKSVYVHNFRENNEITMTDTLEPETMMSLIMADGKIVPISSDGNIIETEVFETDVSACIDNSLLQTEVQKDFWEWKS